MASAIPRLPPPLPARRAIRHHDGEDCAAPAHRVLSVPEVFSQIRDQLASPFAMDTVILISWAIWNMRNELIFNGIQISLVNCRRHLVKELTMLQHRVKPSLLLQFTEWIHNLGF